MELILFPRRQSDLTTNVLPFGMTHAPGEPCSLGDGHPFDPSLTCCAFRAQVVVDALKVLGDSRVAELLSEDLGATAALMVSHLLRVTSISFKSNHLAPGTDDRGLPSGGFLLLKTGRPLPWTRSEREDVLASIDRLADWYEGVGNLGFDVHARH